MSAFDTLDTTLNGNTPPTGQASSAFAPLNTKPTSSNSSSAFSELDSGKPASQATPYFYTKLPSGATMGKSDELDNSGKPLFAYRNPGDTSTTTDRTRVATTFDPTKPQKLSPDTFLTPRAVQGRAALKQSLGGTYNDELDHKISLELSGSNDKSNLMIEPLVPGKKNTATDPLENKLAKQVANGDISLFDAHAQLAKAKGIPAPWGTDDKKEGWIQQVFDKIKNFFIPEAHAETTPSVFNELDSAIKPTQQAAPTTPKLVFDVRSGKMVPITSLPTISEAKTDGSNGPLPLNPGPGGIFNPSNKMLNEGGQVVQDAITDMGNKIHDFFSNLDSTKLVQNGNAPDSLRSPFMGEKIGTGGLAALSITNAILSPLAGIFKGSENLPVVGPVSKLVNTFFSDFLDPNAKQMTNAAIDQLPFPVEKNSPLRELAGELVSSLAQLGAGEIGHAAVPHVIDVAEKVSTEIQTGLKTAATKIIPTKLITPEVVKADKGAIRDFVTGRKTAEEAGITPSLKQSVIDILKNGSREDKVNLIGGGDITSAKPSFLGKLLGVTPDEATAILKDTYGGPTRPAAAGELPGTRDVPGQAPAMGLSTRNVESVGGAAKPTAEPVKPYTGETDLSSTLLEKLKGRTTVSKQFISDLTNSPDLKQPERDLIRKALEDEGTTVNVTEFANKVKTDLLPLERQTAASDSMNGEFGQRYENINLPAEQRGPVYNYDEHLYESPVKTSAGGVHFSGDTQNYFAHTRTEDLPDESTKETGKDIMGKPIYDIGNEGTTRRVIEVQSDLFQKGRLENEGGTSIGTGANKAAAELEAKRNPESFAAKEVARAAEIAKLEPYRNTWQERIAREEIKKAAEDGKTKLQFPTGETAMKIEGLGNAHSRWGIPDAVGGIDELKPEKLKVGLEVEQVVGNGGMEGPKWIITDVLGDGKFKAAPKNRLEAQLKKLDIPIEEYRKNPIDNAGIRLLEETFDISGKVDTSNPIYKFYEKELGRYLTNKHSATRITDAQGVSWYEVPISKEMAGKPITAFKMGTRYQPLGRGPMIAKEKLAELLKGVVSPEKINYVFNPNLLKEHGALGMYRAEIKPIIELMEKGGKVYVSTAFHEAWHYLEDKVFSKEFVAKLNKETLAIMNEGDHEYYLNRGKGKDYLTPESRAEEYRADEFAKEKTAEAGYKSPIRTVLDKIREFLQKIIDAAKKLKAKYDAIPNRQGGFVKNPLFKRGESPKPLSEAEDAAMDSEVINKEHAEELEKIEAQAQHLEITKEALDNNPARQLSKYVSKSGDYKGVLPEVTGKGSIFGRKGDDIVTELGFKNSEEARTAYDKYLSQKEKYQKDLRDFKDRKAELYKKFLEDAAKFNSSTSHLAGRYDSEITADNRGVVPPVVRGGLQAPEMDISKLKDIQGPLGLGALRQGRDTLERNIEKVAGPYAEELKDFLLEDGVRKNELEKVHYVRDIKLQIRKKVKELGIKRRSKEDFLIPQFGEGLISLEELEKQTPKWKEVQSAVDFGRRLYDKVLSDANDRRGKYWYSPIPALPNYFRHAKDINEWTDAFGILQSQGQLPTEIAGLTANFKPGKPFSPVELSRKGGMEGYSFMGGFENWLDSMGKQMFHIDSVQRGRAVEKYIRAVAKQNPEVILPNFVQNIQEWTNLVAGKAAMLDRSIESTTGRPVMKFVKKLSNLVGKNIVAGNLSVALTHLVSIPLNVATVDKVPFIKGLLHTLISPLKRESITEINGVESAFLARRYPEKYILPTKFQKAEETLSWIFHITDVFKSKMTVASKYFENLDNGMSKEEAMTEADKYAGRIIGDYSTGNRPNLMNTHTTQIIAQFQLGVNDGVSVLMHDIPHWEKGNKWKIASRLFAFSIFSFLFNQIYKKIRGSGKGIDPIDAGLTLTGLNEEGQGQGFMQRLSLAAGDLAGELPFTSLFTGTFPLATAITQPLKQAFVQGDLKGAAETVASTMLSPIGGGVQAKKTLEGIQAYNEGKTTMGTGQTKALIPQTKTNLIKGAIFGKTAFSDTRSQTLENNKLLSILGTDKGKVTKQAEDEFSRINSLPTNEQASAFDTLMQSNPSLAKRVETIAKEDKAGVTQSDRLIRQLNVSLGVRANYIYQKLMALPDDTARGNLWEEYVNKGIITKQVATQLEGLLKKGK